MATATMGSPIKKMYGESVSLTTTAAHTLFQPEYHEVSMYCTSAYRMGIAPRLGCVKYYNATAYTDYTTYAIDRVDGDHVPLDAMGTTHYLYLGTTAPVRGFYFNLSTNVNATVTGLDWEYMYDVSDGSYLLVTGTVSGALTVGETVTGGTSGATATVVYSGATSIVVKNIVGSIAIGETLTGAAQNISAITALAPVARGTGYFTDVAGDSDGTQTGGNTTLGQDGLYAFTLVPAMPRAGLLNVNAQPLCWYRFTPGTALSATVDAVDIIPACDTTNYAYMEASIAQQFAVNTAMCGAFEFDHTTSGTLHINWIQH